MAPQRKSLTFSSSGISTALKNSLSKPVAAETASAFSLINPLFIADRLSDLDAQLGDTAKKSYERFCSGVSKLSSVLTDSLSDAVNVCEYNGSENRDYTELEKSIFSSTLPLIMKRKKDSLVHYELYGAIAKPYPKSEWYKTDDMVYTSRLFKKRLNFKPSMALGEVYKILSEIERDKENAYTSYVDLKPDDIYDTETAFIDYNVCENGCKCYRVIADKYLLVCFRINVAVPLYFSDEQDIRYQTLDLPEEYSESKEKRSTPKLKTDRIIDIITDVVQDDDEGIIYQSDIIKKIYNDKEVTTSNDILKNIKRVITQILTSPYTKDGKSIPPQYYRSTDDDGNVVYKLNNESKHESYNYKQKQLFIEHLNSMRTTRSYTNKSGFIKVEALRRYYRNVFRERFEKFSSNRMFEARNANFENLDEEFELFELIFRNAKNVIDNVSEGNILLKDVDKSLRDIADGVARLNILVETAKEFYGNIDSFTIMNSDEYIKKYKAGLDNTMKRAYVRNKIPAVSIDIDLESDRTPIKFRTKAKFDVPLDERTLKLIVNRAGKQSDDINKLIVDVGREGATRATAKIENGNVVFTVYSKSYDKNAYDAERAKMFKLPGKILGVCKLVISEDGFLITAASGTSPEV